MSRDNQWGRGTLDKELKAPGILRPVSVGLSSGSQSTSILHQEFDHPDHIGNSITKYIYYNFNPF